MKIKKGIVVVLALAFFACRNTPNQHADNASVKHDSSIKNTERRSKITPIDEPDETPTASEERIALSKRYDSVKKIDSVLIMQKDTLRLHLEYFCLKNQMLTVPKYFQSDEKDPKDFVTHPFTSLIVLVKNNDTILNRQFSAEDFKAAYKDNFGGHLKKYGTIIYSPRFDKGNKSKDKIVLYYSLAIPGTDLGETVFLVINTDGSYKVEESY